MPKTTMANTTWTTPGQMLAIFIYPGFKRKMGGGGGIMAESFHGSIGEYLMREFLHSQIARFTRHYHINDASIVIVQ